MDGMKGYNDQDSKHFYSKMEELRALQRQVYNEVEKAKSDEINRLELIRSYLGMYKDMEMIESFLIGIKKPLDHILNGLLNQEEFNLFQDNQERKKKNHRLWNHKISNSFEDYIKDENIEKFYEMSQKRLKEYDLLMESTSKTGEDKQLITCPKCDFVHYEDVVHVCHEACYVGG